jgi:hypothetical protein
MIRCLALFLSLLVAVAVADAKTPLRKCRKACRPLVQLTCPPKGKALRACRATLVRQCRRQGVEACDLGLATGGPDDGTTTTTTPDATTTTTTVGPGVTTTSTTLPGGATVAGSWVFEGAMSDDGCDFDASYDVIVSGLAVSQSGSTLGGTMHGDADVVFLDPASGTPAAGELRGGGWSFATFPDCRPTARGRCCLSFVVEAASVASPSPAAGTAGASCDDGFACSSRWSGTVARID